MVPDPPSRTETDTMNERHHDSVVRRRFRIWVDGRLAEHFSNGLSDVEQTDGPDGSILMGEFVDMAHLRSIIDYLLGLGIDVLRFDVDPPSRDERS